MKHVLTGKDMTFRHNSRKIEYRCFNTDNSMPNAILQYPTLGDYLTHAKDDSVHGKKALGESFQHELKSEGVNPVYRWLVNHRGNFDNLYYEVPNLSVHSKKQSTCEEQVNVYRSQQVTRLDFVLVYEDKILRAYIESNSVPSSWNNAILSEQGDNVSAILSLPKQERDSDLPFARIFSLRNSSLESRIKRERVEQVQTVNLPII